MENKKNGLLTLIFACMPGAGEMYLGMMKKGVIIMGFFFGVFGISFIIRNQLIMMIAPVLWFYSFFDTINSRALTMEQRETEEQRFIQYFALFFDKDWKGIFDKRHALAGGILILFGGLMLFNNLVMPFVYSMANNGIIPREVLRLFSSIPTLLIAIVIILIGLQLIKGSKNTIQIEEKDFIDYKGDGNERN